MTMRARACGPAEVRDHSRCSPAFHHLADRSGGGFDPARVRNSDVFQRNGQVRADKDTFAGKLDIVEWLRPDRLTKKNNYPLNVFWRG